MFSAKFRSRSTNFQLCTSLGAPELVPNLGYPTTTGPWRHGHDSWTRPGEGTLLFRVPYYFEAPLQQPRTKPNSLKTQKTPYCQGGATSPLRTAPSRQPLRGYADGRGRTDRRTDGRTDRRTDADGRRRMDGRKAHERLSG